MIIFGMASLLRGPPEGLGGAANPLEQRREYASRLSNGKEPPRSGCNRKRSQGFVGSPLGNTRLGTLALIRDRSRVHPRLLTTARRLYSKATRIALREVNLRASWRQTGKPRAMLVNALPTCRKRARGC